MAMGKHEVKARGKVVLMMLHLNSNSCPRWRSCKCNHPELHSCSMECRGW